MSAIGASNFLGKARNANPAEAVVMTDFGVKDGSGIKSAAVYSSLPESSVLTKVGRGVDVTRCGPYAYDAAEIHYDIFNRNWLNNFYSNGYKDTSPTKATYNIVMTDDVNTMETKMDLSFNTQAFAEGSMDFYKAKVTSDIGFSTSVKLSQKETALVYTCEALATSFYYELPSYKQNLNTFKNQLSEDFLDDINEAYDEYIEYTSYRGRGRISQFLGINPSGAYQLFYPIFEKYGTHVVWKAGFGGALSIVYSARSKSVNLATCLNSNYQNSISASAGVGSNTNSIGGGTSFSLASALNVESTQVKEELKAQFYGGTPGGSGFATSFEGIAINADGWMRTIAQDPTVISYNVAYPIWNFAPPMSILNQSKNLQNIMSQAFNSYQTMKSKGYRDHVNTFYSTENQLTDVQIEKNGQYFYEKGPKEYSWDISNPENYYDVDILKTLGFKKIKVVPTFEIKKYDDVTGRDYDVTVNASLGTASNKSTTFSIRHLKKDEIYSYEGYELDQTLDLDTFKSNSTLKFVFSLNKAPWFFQTNEAIVQNLKITFTYMK